MDGTIVALDGIAIVVNKASKVADLTVDQLKQMFTGEITNWKDVGGDDGEIVLVGREDVYKRQPLASCWSRQAAL